jgi:tripartite ATP-independent transporter DctM subunit
VIVGTLLGLLAVCLTIGMPISHAMGLSAVLALALEGDIPLLLLAQRFYDALDSFPLLAVPLFVLAGEVMNVAGITERLVGLSRALVGHLRGGLAQASIVANMFMSALSGSGLADLAAVGSMMIPAMKREGYRPEFAAAVLACAAMMGPIIPPSIIAVIYGSVTGVSIGALFLGGAIPGVLAGLAMMVVTWAIAPRAGARPTPRATLTGVRHATGRALPALLMPLIIIGGIMSGAFTPTEAGAVAALYAILFGLVTRRHTLASLYGNFASAASVTAGALITLGGAALFSWILSRAGVGAMALRALVSVTDSPALAIPIILAFFFLVGTFLEPVPALIIIVPVMTPIIQHLGFHPVHFGIITIMMLVFGSVTPPVGILAMVACRIAGIEYSRSFAMLVPYSVAWLAVVLLVAYVPALVLWLPSLMN